MTTTFRNTLASLLLATALISVFSVSTLSAQPKPTQQANLTFSSSTTFARCSISTRFACNKIDAGGHRYGTAATMKTCESYVFERDGSVRWNSGLERNSGRYQIRNNTVTIEWPKDPRTGEGEVPTSFQLAADGTSLGGMHLVIVTPAT
jgi:hypothetical protein